MNSLCDISDPDYEKQLKKSRQVNRSEVICKVILFLENQRGIRTMYIGAPDQNSIQKEKKKQSTMKKASIDQQLTQSGPSRCAHLTDAGISELLDELDTEESEDTEDNVSNVDSVSTDSSFDDHYSHYTPPASKQRKRELTVSLQVSTKTMTMENTPAADRIRLSIRDQVIAQSCLINNGGGSLDDFTLSIGSVWRQRTKARRILSENIKKDWIAKEKPKYPVLHWDSKLIDFLSGTKEERVAILISGAESGYIIILLSYVY